MDVFGDKLMTYNVKNIESRLRSRVAILRGDEDGTIIMLGIMITIFVLFFSGFAVDLMRTESQRVRVQSATDRAVLAAADVDQVRPRADVVRDYMRVAGLSDSLAGDPKVGSGNAGEVSVNALLRVNTIFARFADHFDIAAHSTAVNREAEISLVLDISGSMAWASRDEYGYSTGRSKIQDMRTAAATFLDTLLTADVKNRVSVSVVPYSEQVNIGPVLHGAFTNVSGKHSASHCLDVPNSSYGATSLSRGERMDQVAHFNPWASSHLPTYYDYYAGQYRRDRDYYPYRSNARTDLRGAPCPYHDYERVIAFSQDKSAMKAAINQLTPLNGTAIYAGMKWGVALLDPDTKFLSQALHSAGELDTAFTTRPYAYGSVARLKAIVLMTDGENSGTYRIQNWAKDSAEERQLWANYNMDYVGWNNSVNHFSSYLEQRYSKTSGDQLLRNICTAAKAKGIVIYGVAVEMTSSGEAPLRNCVTSPSHFFSVNGGELDKTFRQIARDIKSLRLVR